MNILKNTAFEEITLRVQSGANIGDTVKEVLSIAKTYRCRVNFEFKGTQMSIEPGDNAEGLVEVYYSLLQSSISAMVRK